MTRRDSLVVAAIRRAFRAGLDAERERIPSARRLDFTPLPWQGAATEQGLQRVGLPVELVTPTPKLNAEEWPFLAQRLANGTLVCFPHARLREELLNLSVEVGPTGAKVTDRGKVHQDHAVAVRGVVASLGAGQAEFYVASSHLATSPTCIAVGDDADAGLAAGYRREQAEWARDARRREADAGALADTPMGYGSRGRVSWDW